MATRIAVALGLPELMVLGQVEMDDHFEVTNKMPAG